MTTRTLASLSGAFMLGLPLAAQAAQFSPPASAEASLTDLRYRLVDLAPDDGQDPWLRSNIIEYTLISQSPEGRSSMPVPGSPLPVFRGLATSDVMTGAQVDRDSAVAEVLTPGPYRLPAGTLPTPGQTVTLDERSSSVGVYDSPDMDGPRGFVLAPHTTLILEGTALLATYANAFAVFTQDLQPPNVPYTLAITSKASIGIGFTNGIFGPQVGTSWTAESESRDEITRVFGDPGAATPVKDRDVLPFLVTITNDSDSSLAVNMSLGVRAETFATVTGVVPEPADWALALAGLAIVSLTRRRARG